MRRWVEVSSITETEFTDFVVSLLPTTHPSSPLLPSTVNLESEVGGVRPRPISDPSHPKLVHEWFVITTRYRVLLSSSQTYVKLCVCPFSRCRCLPLFTDPSTPVPENLSQERQTNRTGKKSWDGEEKRDRWKKI